MEEYEKMLNPKTRMVAVVHLSNALGTINPIKQIIDLAHARGLPFLSTEPSPPAHQGECT